MQPLHIILELPVTAYTVIFDFLSVTDLCSCRLVCTKWYTLLTAKRFRKDPGYFIKGTRKNWMKNRDEAALRRNVENVLQMKVFEYASRECMKLKDVHISQMNIIMLKIPEFEADIRNITHLTLENVIFENCVVLLQFLNQFKILQHLTMYHRHNSTSRRYLPLSKNISHVCTIMDGEKLPATLNSLHLIIGDDSNIFHVLPVFILYMDTLTELRLTIIERARSLFAQWTTVRLFFNRKLFHMSDINIGFIKIFLEQMIKKHSKTMKCLHLNWMDEDSIKDQPKVLGTYRFHLILWRYKICKIFQQFLDCPNLALTDFAFNSTTIADHLLSYDIQLEIIPFLHSQVRKGLRKIFLGRIQWDSISLNCQVVPCFLKLLLQGEEGEAIQQLRLTSSEKIVVTASKFQADDVKSMIKNYTDCIVDVEFAIKTHFTWQDQQQNYGLATVNKFSEWLPTPAPEENQFPFRFRQLTTLKIFCEIKTIKSFSIPTICILCPVLTVLTIVDGHGISDTKPKSFYKNYERMSCSKISDCDFQFIFAKLKKLKSLTLWGNMSCLSDFGIVGDRLLENGETSDTQHYLNFKEELTTVLQQEIMMDTNSMEYAEAQLSIPSSTNYLQDLNFLSLRGVGKYVTNAITAPTSRLYQIPQLKTLEITGSHSITGHGKKCLKQVIDHVQLK